MKTRTAIALMLACALPLAAAQAAKGKKVARDYANTIATLQTDMGDIEIEFFDDKAPKHVKNFIDLAKKGFYDGTTSTASSPGFMIQGGDPNTKDTAGSVAPATAPAAAATTSRPSSTTRPTSAASSRWRARRIPTPPARSSSSS